MLLGIIMMLWNTNRTNLASKSRACFRKNPSRCLSMWVLTEGHHRRWVESNIGCQCNGHLYILCGLDDCWAAPPTSCLQARNKVGPQQFDNRCDYPIHPSTNCERNGPSLPTNGGCMVVCESNLSASDFLTCKKIRTS